MKYTEKVTACDKLYFESSGTKDLHKTGLMGKLKSSVGRRGCLHRIIPSAKFHCISSLGTSHGKVAEGRIFFQGDLDLLSLLLATPLFDVERNSL